MKPNWCFSNVNVCHLGKPCEAHLQMRRPGRSRFCPYKCPGHAGAVAQGPNLSTAQCPWAESLQVSSSVTPGTKTPGRSGEEVVRPVGAPAQELCLSLPASLLGAQPLPTRVASREDRRPGCERTLLPLGEGQLSRIHTGEDILRYCYGDRKWRGMLSFRSCQRKVHTSTSSSPDAMFELRQ